MVLDCIDHINYIVAHLLKVIDNIHIVDACLILVGAVVDILHIGSAQLVAEIVDLALFVVGAYDVDLTYASPRHRVERAYQPSPLSRS